jgi:WD40 repeat protein
MQSGLTMGAFRFAFTPDSRLLAAVSSMSNNVVLWDTTTGHQLRALVTDVDLAPGNISGLGDVTFSPDGMLLAAFRAGTIFVWNVRTGALEKRLGTPSNQMMQTSRIQFSPDGQLLAALQGIGQIGIWSTTSAELRQMLQVQTTVDFAFIDEKSIMTIGATDARTYEINSGKQLRSMQLNTSVGQALLNGRIVARRADGHFLVASDQDDYEIWDVTTPKLSRAWHLDRNHSAGRRQSLILSADATYGAIIDGTTISIWDLASQKQIVSVPAFSPSENALFRQSAMTFAEFSPDHRKLMLGDFGGDLRLIEISTGKEEIHLAREDSIKSNIRFTSDEKFLVVGNALWNLGAGTARPINRPPRDISGGFTSPDGNIYAIMSAVDSSIQIWSVQQRQLLRTLSLPKPQLRPGLISISPDGKFLAATYFHVYSAEQLDEAKQAEEDVSSVDRRESKKLAKEQIRGLRRAMKSGDFSLGQSTTSPSQPTRTAMDRTHDFAYSAVVWDLETGSEVKSLDCSSSNLAANTCYPYFSGNGKDLAVVSGSGITRILKVGSWEELAAGSLARQLDGTLESGMNNVNSVDFSPDGHLLAAALFQNSISSPNRATLREQVEAALKKGNGNWASNLGLSLGLGKPNDPSRAMESTIQNYMASMTSSHSGPISILDTKTGKEIFTLAGHSDGSNSVAFSPDGKRLASASKSGEIKLWDLASKGEIYTVRQKTSAIYWLSFSPDGSILASVSLDGSADLWEAEDGSHIATLVSPNEGKDWLIFTPDGLFDGSPSAWRDVLWRFGGDTFNVAPIEMFFNEYYSPGLLAEIMAGKRPHAASKIEDKDRRTPQLSIERVTASDASTVDARELALKIQIHDAPAGAQDLRLFRNGTLVKEWKGDVLQGKPLATIETKVRIIAGENHLTAYAFNSSNIKSQDGSLTVTGPETLRRKGHLFLVAVGVNSYSNPAYNLKFASADAQAFAETVEKNEKSTGSFDGVSVTTLLDSQATREAILSALHDIAAKAQPEDAVSIFLASHGAASGGHFYLVPHDLGYDGSPANLNPDAWKTILSHSISDQDLENAFQAIDTGRILLILDACNSGQALEAEGKRVGPINSRGLAQLAYEKGMYVLAASQSYQAALEVSELGHGLLTHSLIAEGLNERKADFEPKDGKIVVEEWLDYAAKRVPEIQLERMQQTRGLESSRSLEDARRSGQQPRLFSPRTTEASDWIIAGP